MKKTILLGLLLLGVAIGYAFSFIAGDGGDVISKAEAEEASENFINENLIPPDSDQKAEVESVTEENDLYLVSVNLGDQNIKSYITKDGKKFFPQAMNMEKQEEAGNSDNEQDAQQQTTVSDKKEKPVVDLFTMSYCPYGTQMQKAILPAVEALGGKIDFDLQFVDYLMHGEKEMDENLNQYCVQKEHPQKLFSYLNCFLETEESENCMKQEGIDEGKITSCIESADQEYKISEKLNDKSAFKGNYPPFDVDKEANEQYGVSGSPTLVINGEKIQASRTPNALLATICSGFEDEPEECEQQLSSSTPSPGFGSDQSGSDTDASCN
ncbi:MAG: DsbA family protein [Patescibacteria group bacterium]